MGYRILREFADRILIEEFQLCGKYKIKEIMNQIVTESTRKSRISY